MQFITNGPDIPDELLQAHEEGRVVFFCGAGISYPAGLPGFKGLVKDIYRLTGTDLLAMEKEVFNRGQYDVTLDLLERRLPGQRVAVRKKLAEILKPKLRRKGALDTQTALLRLARSREDRALRLVTTNFDRTFHAAAKRSGQLFETYAAPMLPIPKDSRWNGLVFLHGLLPQKEDLSALQRLIVTSGDFGLAYLTERWAARFVSELFRNYIVCFVGYSINDPVLRYMMDALAADRMQGEVTHQAWAFGECEPGQEQRKTIEWVAKGVTPILYKVSGDGRDHSAMHQTLQAWSETYRDGVQGKEAIVVKHALAHPQASTQQDDFVGRMIWAISDKTGLPAKRFAEFNPTPPLDWLIEPFCQQRFELKDLIRFGVHPSGKTTPNVRFSLVQRPAPFEKTPRMQLVSRGDESCMWDDCMFYLARWLLCHLNDSRLIMWLMKQGGELHPRFKYIIEQKLDYYAQLELNKNPSELDEIRLQSPQAIPNPMMKVLWRLMLTGRLKSIRHTHSLISWQQRLKREGMTASMRAELRELLTPKIRLKDVLQSYNEFHACPDSPLQVKKQVDFALELTADFAHSTLDKDADKVWTAALPDLMEDFQLLLRDALDLLHEIGEIDDRTDHSNWYLPSISPHPQNRRFDDWVCLIEFLRKGWEDVYANNLPRASRIGQMWFDIPYPTFKRMALYTASFNNCIMPSHWVSWLLADDAWWLWSRCIRREVLRLLVIQGHNLDSDSQADLEKAILMGPAREMFQPDLEENDWQNLASRAIWLFLAKLKSSGLNLGALAYSKYIELSRANPCWQLHSDESDEFMFWMSSGDEPDYEKLEVDDIAPRKRNELVKWLVRSLPKQRPFYNDTWMEVCKSRFYHSVFALRDLTILGKWPAARWNEALEVWQGQEHINRSWQCVAPLLQEAPDGFLLEVAHAATRWLEKAAEFVNLDEDAFLNLCQRFTALPMVVGTGARLTRNGIETHDYLTSAINHPIGHVTRALLNLWLKRAPKDYDLLPNDIKPFFTTLCDANLEHFCHARVLMGSRLIAFYRVDPRWTEQHLLPLLDWNKTTEAMAIWQGFLWSPRLYAPLLNAFKSQFLDCAKHYDKLGEYNDQFATFLTYLALEPPKEYTNEELRLVYSLLPQNALESAARAFLQALQGAAERAEDYWINRSHRFWLYIWPKTLNLVSPRLAGYLARTAIAAKGEFPTAFEAVKDWLQPTDNPSHVINVLYESGLCTRFPLTALALLDAVVEEQQWAPEELNLCLTEIVNVEPQINEYFQYRRLYEYYQRNRLE
ncbi:SIR2 family protein [Pseudoalteromonas xiamenensis]|uniref:anti-phage defense-associated sirtuin Dsr1 n=1 Tax=Pseudoalteromonas xiamenensis TaxID=882626 RepID=UPI0027E49EE2|nr:anti-phage defense-associated sirtuin Dsr1 [Pseudoalteromonas xiamenensis]WMN59560.1 SIR2 family protein [Pseudoalteromonas xiamenensis]